MKKLQRLWWVFEQPYGVCGVWIEWRRYLGAELPAVAPLLRKLKERSEIYPCPVPGAVGCQRRVVVHGQDDIVAVCGLTPKECDSVKLTPEDIVVYELDLKRFCGFLAQSLELAPVAEPLHPRNDIRQVGTWVASATAQRPVFLVTSVDRVAFDGAIGVLLVSFQKPFVVLTPRLRFCGATAIEGLKRRGAALLALDGIVVRPAEGRLATLGTLPELLAPSGSAALGASTGDRNVFRREQDFWVLSFEGKAIRLKHLAGLAHLVELLRTPGKPLDVLALTGRAGDGENAVVANGGIELADDQALRTVRAALQQREQELARLARNDWDRRGTLEQEISRLKQYLEQSQGRGGKVRKTAGAAEKARKAASAAIKRAMAEIEQHHPELAGHLKSSVQLGITPVYIPGREVDWDF